MLVTAKLNEAVTGLHLVVDILKAENSNNS